MWEINNSLQILTFIRAVVFGIIICIVYDIIRSFKTVFKFSDFSIVVSDILFCVCLTPFIFCFLLATTNGELRGYVAVGILTGFFAIRLTVSKFLNKILCFILSKITFVFCALNRLILQFWRLIQGVFMKNSKKPLILCKKMIKSFKKLLKKR